MLLPPRFSSNASQPSPSSTPSQTPPAAAAAAVGAEALAGPPPLLLVRVAAGLLLLLVAAGRVAAAGLDDMLRRLKRLRACSHRKRARVEHKVSRCNGVNGCCDDTINKQQSFVGAWDVLSAIHPGPRFHPTHLSLCCVFQIFNHSVNSSLTHALTYTLTHSLTTPSTHPFLLYPTHLSLCCVLDILNHPHTPPSPPPQ